MMEFFDSHCHLDDEKFEEDREELISNLYKEGVTKLVSAAYNLKSSRNSLELSKEYEFIYSTCGISPNDLTSNYKEEIEEIEKLVEQNADNKKLVAIRRTRIRLSL